MREAKRRKLLDMKTWLNEQQAIAADFIEWRPVSDEELGILMVVTRTSRLAKSKMFVEVFKDGLFFNIEDTGQFEVFVRNATTEEISITAYALMLGCQFPPMRSIEECVLLIPKLNKVRFAVSGEVR